MSFLKYLKEDYICAMNLVTGGTGLLGAHLILHLLRKGENVRALYRNKINIEKTACLFAADNASELFEKIEWVQGDILDIPSIEQALQGINYVYHCAALISFDPKDEENLRKTNIEGTANMVNCSLNFGIKKFCYVSSIAALGDLTENETVITETTEWNPEKPHSDYAISKHGAEMEVYRASEEGLNTVIVNPGVIIGKGFWDSGSGEIFKKASKGIPFYTLGKTGFVAVEDVCEIMYRLMCSDVSKERFTLISENVILRDFINWICEEASVKKPKFQAKKWMTAIGWRIDWFLSKVLFMKRNLPKAAAKSLHTTDNYSNEKIKKVLDYDFITVEAFCRKTVKSYIAEKSF